MLRYVREWYGMVWYGMVWYRIVRHGTVWYGMVWYGMVLYSTVRYGMVCYGMVRYGITTGPSTHLALTLGSAAISLARMCLTPLRIESEESNSGVSLAPAMSDATRSTGSGGVGTAYCAIVSPEIRPHIKRGSYHINTTNKGKKRETTRRVHRKAK